MRPLSAKLRRVTGADKLRDGLGMSPNASGLARLFDLASPERVKSGDLFYVRRGAHRIGQSRFR
jgi:hypothetical protein